MRTSACVGATISISYGDSDGEGNVVSDMQRWSEDQTVEGGADFGCGEGWVRVARDNGQGAGAGVEGGRGRASRDAPDGMAVMRT